jgi:hypothetical protein
MIQINEMLIKVPSMSEEEGHQIGKDVAQRLANNLPQGIENRQIDALAVRMSLSPTMGREQMTEAIAQQILRQLQSF